MPDRDKIKEKLSKGGSGWITAVTLALCLYSRNYAGATFGVRII